MVLGARRISAASNTLAHPREVPSIQINTGNTRSATPIGNITRRPIRMNGAALPAPFNQLNITT
jgi:hypothetical protein